jgi:uncharacterized protein YutE (UPF0331/DUF86 family)
LPLNDKSAFIADRRNIWSAESCLRRALEALFDLGRHRLAKGFGQGTSEYKEVARVLHEKGVLSESDEQMMRLLAGYRNRMVHFYHEIEAEELFDICRDQLTDIISLADAYRSWLNNNPDRLDTTF